MGKHFPNKRIFITGAGSGLGRAIALKFGTLGWRVAVTDIDASRAGDVLQEVRAAGGEGFAMSCDVRSEETMLAVRDRLTKEWDGVDVVVNNAGVAVAGTVADTPTTDWEWIIDINLMGVVRGCRLFGPLLAQQGSGHIVNIASFAGIAQAPGMASYNVTKSGVISLSETLRAELKVSGVGVSVACPSFFKTNLMESFRSRDDRLRQVAEKLISRASVTADNVADAIYKAVIHNRFMIIPHTDARWLYRLKRYAPELFFKVLARQAGIFSAKTSSKEPDSDNN